MKALVEPQKRVGANVLGVFRDLDDVDRFVWLRGFKDMDARGRALAEFYGGEVWKKHREAANATMLDSDNVLLLRPISTNEECPELVVGADEILCINIHYLHAPNVGFSSFFEAAIRPRLRTLGVEPFGLLETEAALNNFPRLPVREHEPVFIWMTRLKYAQAMHAFESAWAKMSGWRDDVPEGLLPSLMRKPERLRLMRV